MNKKFNQEHMDFITQYASLLKDKELVQAITDTFGVKISLSSIRRLRKKMNLIKKSGRGLVKLQ